MHLFPVHILRPLVSVIERGISLSVCTLFFFGSAGAQIYVSPLGNDTLSGTIDLPYETITKAHSVALAGDTIYVRGGVFDSLTTTTTLSKVGSAASRYYLFAYPGERPLLDFSLMPVNSSNRGIRVTGAYWHVKGLDIKGAGDNGMHVSGSNNIIEFCSFFENMDTGLQLSNGAASNQVINCDSYHNADTSQGNADGFAPKLDVGTGNFFYGCRAWENSDDGFDGYLRPSDNVETIIVNSWVFKNGYLKNGSASTGNGNGFKMGGSDAPSLLRHDVILKNCLAFDNRVKGFDQNNNKGSMTLLHCTGYGNGTNYSIFGALAAGEYLTLTNCAVLGNLGALASFAIQQTNSWTGSFVVTTDDFLSIDTTGVRGPRQSDGSLPEVPFLHLAGGSDLIDGGTDIGKDFNGVAPDIGAFESGPPTSVPGIALRPSSFLTVRNYPNPFNPSTTIDYEIPRPGTAVIGIFDISGRHLRTLIGDHPRGGRFRVQWDGTNGSSRQVASGIYFAVVHFGSQQATVKMQLVR